MDDFFISRAEGRKDARDLYGVAIDEEIRAKTNTAFGTMDAAIVSVDWVR